MMIINTIVIIVPPNPKRFEPLHDGSSNLTKTNNPHSAPAHLWPATTSIAITVFQFWIPVLDFGFLFAKSESHPHIQSGLQADHLPALRAALPEREGGELTLFLEHHQ